MRELAYKIIDWLRGYGWWQPGQNIYVFVNGYRLEPAQDGSVVKLDHCDPCKYFVYCDQSDHHLSMMFLGQLALRLSGWEKIDIALQDELRALFAEYGLYYELGDAWNLSAFKIPEEKNEGGEE